MKTIQFDMLDGRRKRHNRKLPTALEAQEQEALFEWKAIAMRKDPRLALLHAIPNGGWRHPAVGAAMKRQGVLAGMPDVHLPVSRGGYHSLYVELKRIGCGNDLSREQKEVIGALRVVGNAVHVCEGWEEARNVIESYLGG